jgi:hypothetical protein
MKTETNQTTSYIRKTIKSKCKHILRDLTPDIRRRPTLTISTFNDIFVPTQTNQSITLLQTGKSRSKRIISSYSPERYIHHTHNKSIIYSNVNNNGKARSISKKSGSNYKKCYLKRNYGFNSSRSKNGKIVKKTIPTLINKRKRNSSYSKNKGNSMNNLFYVQSFKMPSLSLSSMLNDKEKKCIEVIAKKMFMLVNETKNKEVVINELEMLVQKIKSGKLNNNSNNGNHHNCKSETKNGNDLIKNNSVNSYHSKGRNNNNNMNDVKKNLKSFKKIKMHPKNITDEVDQMKYQYNITQLNNINNIRTNNNNSKVNNNNTKVNVNKSKISMKNASLNLHMIPKVNGIEKQSKHSGNDSSQLIINNIRSNGGNMKNEDINNNNNIHLLELKLDEIQNNKVRNFNDEFLENYEEFSPSWRLEIDKMNQRKNY